VGRDVCGLVGLVRDKNMSEQEQKKDYGDTPERIEGSIYPGLVLYLGRAANGEPYFCLERPKVEQGCLANDRDQILTTQEFIEQIVCKDLGITPGVSKKVRIRAENW